MWTSAVSWLITANLPETHIIRLSYTPPTFIFANMVFFLHCGLSKHSLVLAEWIPNQCWLQALSNLDDMQMRQISFSPVWLSRGFSPQAHLWCKQRWTTDNHLLPLYKSEAPESPDLCSQPAHTVTWNWICGISFFSKGWPNKAGIIRMGSAVTHDVSSHI